MFAIAKVLSRALFWNMSANTKGVVVIGLRGHADLAVKLVEYVENTAQGGGKLASKEAKFSHDKDRALLNFEEEKGYFFNLFI